MKEWIYIISNKWKERKKNKQVISDEHCSLIQKRMVDLERTKNFQEKQKLKYLKIVQKKDESNARVGVRVSCSKCFSKYSVALKRHENRAICPFCGGITAVNIE